MTALLIHGAAEGSYVWDEFAPGLLDYCKVLAVDLRGHGESDHDPQGQYMLDMHIRDIEQVLEELQLDQVILVGHSLGGDIVTNIAPRLSGRLCALVIVDSGPGGDPETARYLQAHLRKSHKLYSHIDDYTQWLRDNRPLAKSEVLERLASASLVADSDGYIPRFDIAVLDMITAEDDQSWWLPSLRQTMAPVLVVRGIASAALARQTAEQICMAARNGELVTVSAAGHAVMNDNAEGFARAVIPFIARATRLAHAT